MRKTFALATLAICAVFTGWHVWYSDSPSSVNKQPTTTEISTSESWLASATREIELGEYHIQKQKDGLYSSVNRKNNVRATYTSTGFSASPRVKNELGDWNISYTVKSIAKNSTHNGRLSEKQVEYTLNNEQLHVSLGDAVVEYINNEEGMRQNFIVNNRPDGDGMLVVNLGVETTLTPRLDNEDDIQFVNKDGVPVVWYRGLKAWDAAGKELHAFAQLEGNDILLKADDADAVYPVTIDPITTSAAWGAEGQQNNAQFGWSVASAGDLNNDGYNDVVIGAPMYDMGQQDEGAVFVYMGTVSGLPIVAARTLESNQLGAQFGLSAASAGDINNDGFGDLVVGAPLYDNGEVDEGAIFVYLGSATGVSAVPTVMKESNQTGAQLGYSVGKAGRINADAFPEILAGAPFYDNVELNEGALYIFNGSAAGLSAAAPTIYEGNQDGAQMGSAVVGGADFNRDGRHDIAVSLPLYDNGQTNEGVVWVFYGQVGGSLTPAPNWTSEANQPDAQFGFSISAGGDVNGDGFSDLLVGSPFYQVSLANEGRALVYHGSATGLSAAASWTTQSGQTNARLGYSVSIVGDVNNDGNDDVLIGSPLFDGGLNDEGRAQLHLGSTNGVAAAFAWMAESDQANAQFGLCVSGIGDVNRDGYDDYAVSAPYFDNGELDEGGVDVFLGSGSGVGNADAVRDGREGGSSFGYVVQSAGDVNGDGYSDVIVGAPMHDKGDTLDVGRVFVYYGSPVGLAVTASWSFQISQANAHFGSSVGTAGDVNNDGYSDIFVTAPMFDGGEIDEGKVWVFHGGANGLGVVSAFAVESNQTGARLGFSASCAGDVNGDGFSDLLIGAPNASNGEANEGVVYLYRGSSQGLVTTSVWSAESNQVDAQAGFAVAHAVDVNADGFSDIAFSAPYINSDADPALEGRVYVYYGSASFAGVSPDWVQTTDQDDALFGYSVNGAGDVNGDGYSDLIVGVPRYDNGHTDEGRVLVYYGGQSGLSAGASWIAESNKDNGEMGTAVNCAGDVNGDGYADIVAGAAGYTNGQAGEGAIFVYLGTETGLSIDPVFSAESDQANAMLGTSCATAGDIDGDGYSDIVAGAPYYSNQNALEGRIYLYNGKSNGLSSTPSQTLLGQGVNNIFGSKVVAAGDINGDGYADVMVTAPNYRGVFLNEGRAYLYYGSANGLPTTASVVLSPTNQVNSYFGFSAASAGDVNNDGYNDLIIGAPFYQTQIGGLGAQGRVYIYHGGASGLNTTPAMVIDGFQENAQFGYSVSGVNDVNGDGFGDIVIGEPQYDDSKQDVGRTHVYYGSSTGILTNASWIYVGTQQFGRTGFTVNSAGDFNGDGLADVIMSAPYYDNGQTDEGKAWIFPGAQFGLSTTPSWTAESNQASALFGFEAKTAGDIDGNGYSDIIISALLYDNGENNEGRVYLYSSSSSGVSQNPTWIGEVNIPSTEFGRSISSAGDVNGDGFGDIVVGAPLHINGQVDEGRAYIYYGTATGLSAQPNWAVESNREKALFGCSAAGIGDVNGDGYPDIAVGAMGDPSVALDAGSVHLFYGNSVNGKSTRPRQQRIAGNVPIVAGYRTQDAGSVNLGATLRSFIGRTTMRAEFEVRPIGTAFTGGNIAASEPWTTVSASGAAVNRNVAGLTQNTSYKWRSRLRYRLNNGAVQMYSRWFKNVYPTTPGASAFRVGNSCTLAANAGSDITICSGNPGLIGMAPTGGVSPLVYRWKPSTGLSDSTIQRPIANPSQSTTYVVTITDANQCISFDTVTVSVVPGVSVKSIEDISICPGDTVRFTTQTMGGTGNFQYEWTPNFTLNSPVIANPIAVPPRTTTYVVKVVDFNQCYSFDTVVVTVKNAPQKPTITQSGTTLSSSVSSAYQWFKDGQIIPGATQQTYELTGDFGGAYRVRITNDEGCSSQSDSRFLITSVDEGTSLGVWNIYPNPAENRIFVKIPDGVAINSSVTISNTLGSVVKTMSVSEFQKELSVDIANLASGVYVISFKVSNGEAALWFVKK